MADNKSLKSWNILYNVTNIVDRDEMQHNEESHQGLHYLLKYKQSLETEIHYNFEFLTTDPIVCNELSELYCTIHALSLERPKHFEKAVKMECVWIFCT